MPSKYSNEPARYRITRAERAKDAGPGKRYVHAIYDRVRKRNVKSHYTNNPECPPSMRETCDKMNGE